MFLNKRVRAAAAVAVAVGILTAAPVATAALDQATHALDTEQVDVATISLDQGLTAEDGTQQPRGPKSVLYTTTRHPTGIDAGEVYGDTVRLRLNSAEGPAVVAVEPLRLPVGERGATNWTFPEAGRHTLTLPSKRTR
ncbi:hypothetical protein [Amycolatopsis sp. YIM 10]|uniref:hypothetical protein n=1 Tax=Amycolatopsis sp. YIM 10 TaxID=2653857 RepID=UPI00128FF381|nr:hypothetical protein [Amycolatopsis sp. YIM 10]QFU88306.1 hypothetical protein YIM_15625 [Amycolatopsis sp. YIM 10]